ncbi:MAG: TetR/AcrR family transcriptional regulator, partial [Deltaproteobacteria bacterium]|nr:TetR/AcrR family transcriptional regulator [Deltaproteobacteria bacterium]
RKSMVAERGKSAQKKDAILDAAIQLFLEKGYNATSTNDVCSKAKINKPSLYNFFKNKRNLFFACHMRSIDTQLLPYLEKASSIKEPEERLGFMIREFTRMICKSPELKVLIHETMSMKDDYFWKIRSVWKKHFWLLRETISELRDMGLIKTTLSPSRAALFLLGMMTWITFWFDYGRTHDIDNIAESAMDFALRGLSYKKS